MLGAESVIPMRTVIKFNKIQIFTYIGHSPKQFTALSERFLGHDLQATARGS